ncbi:hypothetical protein B0T11DRAFT_113159 [Plectosphaerella cucumerina]|uniref:Uncharacterized protein n=1 Tax=Plectosphaerella cucumerina TaxID=40658 RepID=A0A8K0TIJ5_9PEZI|nr:hypothetical protein B0T11DRAFT_113159 [Plectosphaerella cucumerina]
MAASVARCGRLRLDVLSVLAAFGGPFANAHITGGKQSVWLGPGARRYISLAAGIPSSIWASSVSEDLHRQVHLQTSQVSSFHIPFFFIFTRQHAQRRVHQVSQDRAPAQEGPPSSSAQRTSSSALASRPRCQPPASP